MKFNLTFDEFINAFGGAARIVSPENGMLPTEAGEALFVVEGSVDLFVARRLEGGGHGRAVPLRSLTAGDLVPPFPEAKEFVVFGRPLTDAKIALVRWTLVAKSRFLDAYETDASAMSDAFAAECRAAFEKIGLTEAETAARIRENRLHQERREAGVFETLSALFDSRRRIRRLPDGEDPVAAAAARVAAASGITGFTLPKGATTQRRLELAEEAGRVRITPARLEGEWFRTIFAPVLLVAKDGSDAYAAISTSAGDAVAWSGATGRTYVIDGAFCETVEGMGWNFVKPFPKGPVTASRLLRLAASFCGRAVTAVALLALGGVLLEMVTPVVTSMIFSDVVPNANRTMLGMLFALLLVTALAKTCLESISHVALMRIRDQVVFPTELALVDRLLRLPVDFFRSRSAGKTAHEVTAVETLSGLLTDAFFSSVLKMLFVPIPVAMIFCYSLELSLVVLPIYLLLVAVLLPCSYFIMKYSLENLRLDGERSGILASFVSGFSKLRSAGAENHALLVWSRKMAEGKSVYRKYHLWNIVLDVSFSILPWLVFCATTTVIAWRFLSGETGVGVADFAGFLSAAAILNATLVGFLTNAGVLFRCAALLRWMQPLLEADEEEDPSGPAGEAELGGSVALDHVSFAYDPERPILKDVSLHADSGEFIAVTGESGAGKSTLLRLLLQFERPTSGTVLYDQEDVANLNMRRVRSRLGVVLQNADILAGSILSNIIGVNSQYTEDDAWRAAEAAGCADDIRGFPMGMHTCLMSSAVSGGQKQRILLARALIRDPKIIFLDEATSALDNRAQRHVIESLKKVEATKIVIAHRLSTVLDADRIYVLKEGRIVEVGTARELMEKNGVFAAMAKRQLINQEGEGHQ